MSKETGKSEHERITTLEEQMAQVMPKISSIAETTEKIRQTLACVREPNSGVPSIVLTVPMVSVGTTVTQDEDKFRSLGNTWKTFEDAWEGVWRRRPGTNVFDATWTLRNPNDPRIVETVKGVLEIFITEDNVVFVRRKSSEDDNKGNYAGFKNALGKEVTGYGGFKSTTPNKPSGTNWGAEILD